MQETKAKARPFQLLRATAPSDPAHPGSQGSFLAGAVEQRR